jgi:predicted Zn-dependent peptidase
MRFVFDAGSRYEEKTGLAHFAEHMIIAGTKKFPSKDALVRFIDATGGSVSCATNQDYMYVKIEIAEMSDFPMALEVIDQMINDSLFDERSIESERGAILTEIQIKRSRPDAYVSDLSRELLHQGTALARSTIGDEAAAKSITREDLLRFKEKYIKLENATLIMAGDIDESIVRNNFQEIGTESTSKPLPIYYDKKFLQETTNSQPAYFVYGTRLRVLSLKERAAIVLATTYLTADRSGKLFEELRYKRGFIYILRAHIASLKDWAQITISSSTDSKNLDETIKIIEENIKKVCSDTLTEGTLKYLKSKITKSYIINLQSSNSVVDYSQTGLMANEPYSINQYLEVMRCLTATEVKEIFSQLVNTKNFCLTVLGGK